MMSHAAPSKTAQPVSRVSLRTHLSRIARLGKGAAKRRGDSEYYARLAILAAKARAENKRRKVVAG